MTVENISIKKSLSKTYHRKLNGNLYQYILNHSNSFAPLSRPIEQFYLSHPDEPFSLRCREILQDDGSLTYEATLKDSGKLTENGLQRLEVSCPISPEAYASYKATDPPLIRKLRSQPMPDIAINFFEDGSIIIESESDEAWAQFKATYGVNCMEITGDKMSTSQWQAHLAFRRSHDGIEALKPDKELTAADISNDILQHLETQGTVTTHIAGRTGSGKSTIIRQVADNIRRQADIEPIMLSTDDYHRGVRWLTAYNHDQPWTHWDDPIVYDTAALA